MSALTRPLAQSESKYANVTSSSTFAEIVALRSTHKTSPLNQPDLDADPGGDLPHLPEREEAPAQPLFHGNAPTQRLRRKTAPPPAIPLVSMLHIEGEKLILQRYMRCFEFQLPRDPENDVVFPVPSEDSWALETEQSPRQAPLPDDDEDENESGGEGHDDGRASVILRKFQFWKTWA